MLVFLWVDTMERLIQSLRRYIGDLSDEQAKDWLSYVTDVLSTEGGSYLQVEPQMRLQAVSCEASEDC